ncbi:MAG: histidine kinase [Anaerolineae bacterium]|jgi:two-component system sensor histidine kinase DegS
MASTQSGVSIQQLVDEYRKDYEQTQNELKEIDLLIQQTATEVDRLAQRSAQATNRLRQVESAFESVPREDIREAYSAVQSVQQRLFTMRGQLEKLQSDQKHLEQRARILRRLLELSRSDIFAAEENEGEPAESDTAVAPSVVRLIETQERERKRLARQMHDGPAQSLTNLVLQAEICERLFESDPERARVELVNLKAAVSSTFQRVKNFISSLRPMMLDDLGLLPTLRRYVEDYRESHNIGINLNATGRERRVANHKEVTTFRVIQELLNNARDFSRATSIQLTVDMGDDCIFVAVEDNGSGFDASELTGGSAAEEMGLNMLRERIEMLRGDLQVESSPGRGTRVTFEIPLP